MIYRSIGFGTDAYDEVAKEALRAQREIIERVAEEGPCVIVGRMADQVLADRPELLRIFISAGEDSRIRRIMERDGLSREKAEKKMKRVDKERAGYYNQRGKKVWGAAESYDLCIDTDRFGMDGTVALISRTALSL